MYANGVEPDDILIYGRDWEVNEGERNVCIQTY